MARAATLKALSRSHMQELTSTHWCCYVDAQGVDPEGEYTQDVCCVCLVLFVCSLYLSFEVFAFCFVLLKNPTDQAHLTNS